MKTRILQSPLRIDVSETPVKAVYSSFTRGGFHHCSLTTNPYTVVYTPGEWTEPVLPNSRLFFYCNLRSAVYSLWFVRHPWNPRTMHTTGISLWWCEVDEISPVGNYQPDPPPNLVDDFWRMYNPRWAIGSTDGTLLAKRVRLMYLVNQDEIDEMITLTKGSS